jgi:D-amino-acid dehydrogenase
VRVLVVGAGAVGLSSAYFLARAGAEVTVIDERGVGGGASRRNAGWVVPSMSGPVPAPGMVLKSLRWMTRRTSPLYVRPTLDPAALRFLVALLRHCNHDDFERGLRQTLALNARTFELFDELERQGVRFEHHRRGLLQVFTGRRALAEHAEEAAHAAGLGAGPSTVLTADEARDREPLLGPEVVGAISCPEERYLDPDSFVDGLAEACTALGVTFHDGERAASVDADPDGRVRAVTARRRWGADAFVVATGAWTAPLAAAFGQRLPVRAGKGYGFDVPNGPGAARTALYLSEAKVAVTPLDGRVRLAGTMELGVMSESVDLKRAGGIVSSARRYLSGWPQGDVGVPWAGLRPMTPDGLPVLGRLAGHDNVVVAAGHAMLGITLAPVTGDIVRQLVLDGRTPPEAEPFRPDRFGRSGPA